MEIAKLILIFFFSFTTLLQSLVADYQDYEGDEFVLRRREQAKRAALEAYHHNPHQVINHLNHHVHLATKGTKGSNSTRRSLARNPYKGPCMATNPIDQCWRCKKNWADDRKSLAKCVLGFGRNTTGGAAGEYYVVTDASDDDVANPKPGTLRWAVIQKEPLWITFARSMNIKLTQELMINCDKTIDGRGAMIRITKGSGLTIQFVRNVIIHGLKIYDVVPGTGAMIRDSVDHIGLRTASDGDGINVFGSTDVWIDHISMSNCKDGLIDIIEESTAITVSNCHMTHHNDVMLFGASDSRPADGVMQITVAFNHFGKGLVQRMPRCRFGFFHVVNNDYIHWLMYAIGGSSNPTILCQGNRFIAPPNKAAREVTHRCATPESEWVKWSWTSDGDLLMDGAIFRASGSPPTQKHEEGDIIGPQKGEFVRSLTRFAGNLGCKINCEC